MSNRQQDGELLAAVAGDEVVPPQFAPRQTCGDRLEAGIAGRVAVAVVEPLEVIDVDHQEGERLAGLRAGTPLGTQSRVERAPVGDPGEPVELRQRLELPVLLDQDVLARR